MKTVLIVGDSMKQLREKILELGYDYVQLRDIRKCKNPEKTLKRRVVCDFSSQENIDKALDELRNRYQVDGIISTYENYILQAAYVAEQLGLRGMPISAAEACTDKYIMRGLFANAPRKISPAFKEAHSFEDVLDFMHSSSFPVILKPANLAKSLLVTKSNNIEELKANYEKTVATIDAIYKKYAPNRTPKILIEEFMEGPVHSVDAFVDENGTPHVLENVVDYQTGYDIGYDDNFHYSRILPSKLSSTEVADIREVATLGCKALGMLNSPAHVEIIRTKNGPMIVEIGARNGGYRERMHGIANGIDIIQNALALSFGEPLDITSKRNDSCAVLELFPKKPGIFSGVASEAQLQNLSSLVYFAVKQHVGSFVGKSSDGYKMCAIIILHNVDANTFDSDLALVNSTVFIETTDNQ
jgi:biotin carboxylase